MPIDIPDAQWTEVFVVVNIPRIRRKRRVAEGAFAMLIASGQKNCPTLTKTWTIKLGYGRPRMLGLDIADKTLGLIGCGKIGHQ